MNHISVGALEQQELGYVTYIQLYWTKFRIQVVYVIGRTSICLFEWLMEIDLTEIVDYTCSNTICWSCLYNGCSLIIQILHNTPCIKQQLNNIPNQTKVSALLGCGGENNAQLNKTRIDCTLARSYYILLMI